MPKRHHVFALTHNCHMCTVKHDGSSKIKHASIPIGCSWNKCHRDCHWATVLGWFNLLHNVNGLNVLVLLFLIDQDIQFVFHFPLFLAIFLLSGKWIVTEMNWWVGVALIIYEYIEVLSCDIHLQNQTILLKTTHSHISGTIQTSCKYAKYYQTQNRNHQSPQTSPSDQFIYRTVLPLE